MEKTECDRTNSYFRIVEEIALSDEPISVYEIANVFGGKSRYSHIHKTCKRLIQDWILVQKDTINERHAPKKVMGLTMRGFCYFVCSSKIFRKYGWGADYSQDELEELNSFFKRWCFLNPGIEIFYELFLKYQVSDDERVSSHAGELIESFGRTCNVAFYIDIEMTKSEEKNEDGDFHYVYEVFFLERLIENLFNLPKKTSQEITLEEIIKQFKTHYDKDFVRSRVEEEMEERKIDSEATILCYQKFF